MNIIVTGAAGFIGSHLCARLLQNPLNRVIGIDGIVQPELRPIKERNLSGLRGHKRFQFIETDLLRLSWKELLAKADAVCHLAGMPGVRSSWGDDFRLYIDHNIAATQRLLEACVRQPPARVLFASTSSVYGQKSGTVSEDARPEPLSPYGITKLTCEHLCRIYGSYFGIPVVILRYFTVYGPRQREDMAFHRFIRQLLTGRPLTINGDGTQTRDYTYVEDCVDATVAALHADNVIGETLNIGGKERASVLEIIAMLEQLHGSKADMERGGSTVGEPKHTWADISKAQRLLGYSPKVSLLHGLAREWADLKQLYQI